MACITLTELNALTNTNLSVDHDVDYLENILDVVCGHVTTYCMGTLFELTDVTDERHRAYVRARPPYAAKLRLKVKYTPVNSVSALSYKIGSTTTTITIDELEFDPMNGNLEMFWYGPVWRRQDNWNVLVSYNAGYDGYPDKAKMAVALLTREWVAYDDSFTGGTRGELKSFRIGSYSEAYFSRDAAASGNLGMGTPMSQRARQLLASYRRPGVAVGAR